MEEILDNSQSVRVRQRMIFALFLICFWTGLLVLRLAQVMVFEPDKFLQSPLAQEKWQRVSIPAKRGSLLHPDGRKLAWSELCFRLKWAETAKYRDIFLEAVKVIPDLSIPPVGEEVGWVLKDRLTVSDLKKIPQLHKKFLEVEVEKYWLRHSESSNNLIGKVSEDQVGISGLEFKYDSLLRGSEGEMLVLRNKRHSIKKEKFNRRPVKGRDVTVSSSDLR